MFVLESPLGTLRITTSSRGITALDWGKAFAERPAETPQEQMIATALQTYFAGRPSCFQNLPLDLSGGTPFQQSVWRTLLTIPYGETRSYAWLADTIGNPKALRAVGQANGRNPIPIIIPCHRIINKRGELGGYALGADGGLSMKRFLLDLEHAQQALPLVSA